ncbi:hypothetical protein QCA50_000111 [Cerrena zonata]|uniref:RRM domain-containing protein n=1 Tax=Cerrena zonata TaxID=2478898 RepID=A0AAW0GQJ1_9APHY
MSRSIYIGGLPDSVGQDDIHKHLEIYGKITAIYIYPGYGFVEFESDAVRPCDPDTPI